MNAMACLASQVQIAQHAWAVCQRCMGVSSRGTEHPVVSAVQPSLIWSVLNTGLGSQPAVPLQVVQVGSNPLASVDKRNCVLAILDIIHALSGIHLALQAPRQQPAALWHQETLPARHAHGSYRSLRSAMSLCIHVCLVVDPNQALRSLAKPEAHQASDLHERPGRQTGTCRSQPVPPGQQASSCAPLGEDLYQHRTGSTAG